MDELKPPLKQGSGLSREEEAAAKLTRARAEHGDVPPHPMVGERGWERVEEGLQQPPPRGLRRLSPRALAAASSTIVVGLTLAFIATRTADVPLRTVGTFPTELASAEATTLQVGTTRLVVGPKSVLVFVTDDHHDLQHGTALYEVAHGNVALKLAMGPWDVTVSGSRFWALRNAKENVIEVYDGSVKLRTGTRELELRPGDVFREHLGDDRTTLDSVVPTPSAPAPDPSPPPPRPQKVDKMPSLSEALEHVRAGHYPAAEAIYLSIAEHNPAQAEVALYSLAKMKAQKQKAYTDALGVLDQLDRRFAHGALDQERALTRIEILFRTAQCDVAKRAVQAYVKVYTHAIDSLREIDASHCEAP